MIWFACGKCGKVHGRPENSIGSLVFCDCGQGNLVPWESTAPEPPPQVATAAPGMPATPTLAPMTFDLPPSPPPVPRGTEASARGRARGERRDPNYCLNHQSTPKAGECEDCREAFCAACLVTMQGATLCGPCKNFRARTLELPPRSSTTALASVAIALLAGGVLSLCLLPLGHRPSVRVLGLLALLPQVLALGLGVRALYLSSDKGRPGGQAWAVTGVTAAAVTVTLTLLVSLYAFRA